MNTKKTMVVLSYFDPFDGALINNSREVAFLVKDILKESGLLVMLCELPTVFDEASQKLSDLILSLDVKPILVLSLGEGKCDFRVETMAHNLDHTKDRGDNKNQRREHQKIINGAHQSLGLRFNLIHSLQKMSAEELKWVKISLSPGEFVCNNTAFLFSHAHPDLNYGFIHVPNHRCDHNQDNIQKSASVISKMLLALETSTNISNPLVIKKSDVLILSHEAQSQVDKEIFRMWLSAFKTNDPLHGLKLETILETLVDRFGWEELAEMIPVRCFLFDPSIKSSLIFLRRTPWARKKIEDLYLSVMNK